ncbi:O-acetyl-ADP-ribose deacetylase [Vibrio japonicus]|uniref:O-acetyl-ADP-ribose deacetylase n=1 Tax=Vibrio japonicus TaxID=1824638 RepID=A0ABY5LPK5_9VIBR|nr:O-acetyl-ADP-ribose deacetylase [Vibrio japonicus]UUM32659.1 O-acetyl-ADP-ribose deacetylase [Vibrio japonicus]
MNNIHLINGDITKANVDAIVNAANPTLLGGGGVDGAIHRAAGPELLKECYGLEETDGVRCPFGKARITTAGQLHARFVIHTVGPIYNQFSDPKSILESAYTHSLDLALENGCETVALPAISCGVYGYPPEEAAEIALSVCAREKYQSLTMTFYLFGDEMLRIWQLATKS